MATVSWRVDLTPFMTKGDNIVASSAHRELLNLLR